VRLHFSLKAFFKVVYSVDHLIDLKTAARFVSCESLKIWNWL